MISYCITCMGRRHHVERTLPANIAVARGCAAPFEFVLLDYSSPDGLAEYVACALADPINAGLLSYYRMEGAETFHMAHAKNLAHRLAQGAVLCNLDADNFLQPDFCNYLADTLIDGRVVAAFPRDPASYGGSSGRIALRREHFEELGGYNEQLRGWGWEDVDFLERAALAGFASHTIPLNFADAIEHSHEFRVQFQPVKRRFQSSRQNRRAARRLIAEHGFRANPAGFGKGKVFRNFSTIPTELN